MAETLDTAYDWRLAHRIRRQRLALARLRGIPTARCRTGARPALAQLLHAGHGGEIPPAAVSRRRRRLPDASPEVRLLRPTPDLGALLLSHFKIEPLHGRAAAS